MMLEALKSLFENNVISEDIKASIEEAWADKITENRQEVTAELREEFAQKYDHDKSVMAEAVEKMVEDRLGEEITEFADDRTKLAEARAKYHVAMRENADLLKNFVVAQLGKEVSELHEDQKVMSTKFGKLEEFVVEALAKEIAEFHEDKKDLAETKVRLIREAKKHLNTVKEKFVKNGAKVVENTVAKTLTKEIGQLKEDIDVARKNDFGRKLFETFQEEYTNSYLNEKSETAKLLKVVEVKDKQLAEAKATVKKATKLVESKDLEFKKAQETAKRKDVISGLTAPLSNEQKEIMTDLLESVQTANIQKQFDKYLPSVIDGNTPEKKKATLTEAKEVTGNKEESNVRNGASNSATDNVVDIRRLAGLK